MPFLSNLSLWRPQEDVDVDAVVSARAFSFVMVHVYRGALPKERW